MHLDALLPDAIRLERLGISFTLPTGVSLNAAWDRELCTRGACLVRLGFTRDALDLAASPPLHIDARWPAKNMALSGLTLAFGAATLTAHVGDRRVGLLDFQQKARAELEALGRATIAGTPMARPGYDPFADADLVTTLRQLGQNFSASPTRGTTGVTAEHLQAVAVDAEISLPAGLDERGLRVPPGGRLAVTLSGAGGLADVLRAPDPTAALLAADLRHLALTSDDLTLHAGGAPIGRLQQLRLLPGGRVQIDRLALDGPADLAAGVETLVGLLYRAARFSQAGLAPDAATLLAAHPKLREGEVIADAAAQLIAELLTDAVQGLMAGQAAVAGVDVRAVLGLG
ncbi:MAG: hypothetical protein H6706_29520 [Myxococcales bacterium]|nr:hypothetical protein [Myxococcales bacterium]